MVFSTRNSFSPVRLSLPCVATALLGLAGCPGPQVNDEASGSASEDSSSETPEDSESGDDSPQIICAPGETRCVDEFSLETCAPTGLEWEASSCEDHETCEMCFGGDEDTDCVAACVGPCEKMAVVPSSEGCSFFTTGMLQAMSDNQPPDAIIVANPNTELSATIQLSFVPEGSNQEELVEGPIELMPGDSYEFLLPPEQTLYGITTSVFRSGLVHHVTSNLPIVAYLHSPYEGNETNESSMLLPENVLTGNYVVYGHKPFSPPSYFVVIAVENQTTVRWTPTFQTAGDALPLDFVEANTTGEQLLNRFDNMLIMNSALGEPPRCDQDLSGTVIEADKPIWVVSATRAARIPYCNHQPVPGCDTIIDSNCFEGSDYLQEQSLPLEFWGREYVGPHSPLRGNESHYWRIFAGEDDVTITVDPPQPGTPINLAKRGEWQELVVPTGTNLLFTSNKVFMPVQYLSGHHDGNDIGSPAMVQMIPTAQFLDRYVFVTGVSYDHHYVQVIREGSDDVILDGQPVGGWAAVGDWEVTSVEVAEGPHSIESEGNFGIIQYGWTKLPSPNNTAGYAYPGGMKAEVVYFP